MRGRPGVVTVDDWAPGLCAPVCCNGMLLGDLWPIDRDGEFGAADTAADREAADAAGTVLYRRLLLHERSKARRESILRELVSPDAAVRARAIEDLHAEQALGDDPLRFTVLAVHCRDRGPPRRSRWHRRPRWRRGSARSRTTSR